MQHRNGNRTSHLWCIPYSVKCRIYSCIYSVPLRIRRKLSSDTLQLTKTNVYKMDRYFHLETFKKINSNKFTIACTSHPDFTGVNLSCYYSINQFSNFILLQKLKRFGLITNATSWSIWLIWEVLEKGPKGWQPVAQSQFTTGLSCTCEDFSYGALNPPTAEASPANICRCANDGTVCLLSVSET